MPSQWLWTIPLQYETAVAGKIKYLITTLRSPKPKDSASTLISLLFNIPVEIRVLMY